MSGHDLTDLITLSPRPSPVCSSASPLAGPARAVQTDGCRTGHDSQLTLVHCRRLVSGRSKTFPSRVSAGGVDASWLGLAGLARLAGPLNCPETEEGGHLAFGKRAAEVTAVYRAFPARPASHLVSQVRYQLANTRGQAHSCIAPALVLFKTSPPFQFPSNPPFCLSQDSRSNNSRSSLQDNS